MVFALMMSPVLPSHFLDLIDFLGLNDKDEHFIAFFLLSFLLNRASSTIKRRLRNAISLAIFAISIEFIQALIPERSASFTDFIADLLGILAFQLCFSVYLFFVKRKNTYKV